MMQLIMKKWEWMEGLYEHEPRAFAFRLAASGIAMPVDLVNYVPRRERSEWPKPALRKSRGRRPSPESTDQAPLM